MQKLLSGFAKQYLPTITLFIFLLLAAVSANAQCEYLTDDLYVHGQGTYNQCGPAWVTARAELGFGFVTSGEFIWWESEDATEPIKSDAFNGVDGYSEYTFYASQGSKVWVSLYSDGCESERMSYSPSFQTPVSHYINFARECGTGIAQIQMTSPTPGVAFQLYHYNGQGYDQIGQNTTGYFEIQAFNPSQQYSYFSKVTKTGACLQAGYHQIDFDIQSLTPPTVTGNLTPCEGVETALIAEGNGSYYRWYDAETGAQLFEGIGFELPVNAPGVYNYLIRGFSPDGCVTNSRQLDVFVIPTPREETITASAATIYIDQSVTISTSGGIGSPHYWCSNDAGANWNIFQNAFANKASFSHTPPAVGTYRYHYRNATDCGFCWDMPAGCTDFKYVDVTVIPWPAIVLGAVTPPTQIVYYNGTATPLSVSSISGGDGSYSYQWQQSADGVTFHDINGATGSTYTPTGIKTKTWYRVIVTSHRVPATSNIVWVDAWRQLKPGVLTPSAITLPAGAIPGKLSAGKASGGGCNGSYTYEWQQSTDGITFTAIAGANDLTYQPPALSVNTWYRRKVSCGAEDAYTNACVITIGTLDVDNLNYIRTRAFTHAGILTEQDAVLPSQVAEVKQSTAYLDGLGRVMQAVDMQAGKNNKDVVTPVLYDNYGRQPQSWLPYVSGATNGKFKLNALSELNTFHAIQNPDDAYYYQQSDYEASPLNRIEKTMAAGDNWVGAGRGIENGYHLNTVVDDVKIWHVNDVVNDWGNYIMDGAYPEGQLSKTITTDEDGKQVIEFKDTQGQLLLKKVQLTAAPDDGGGSGYAGWLCTYYVYDDLNQLRAVVQPKGVQTLHTLGWPSSANGGWGEVANELSFRYEYDVRKRLTRRKLPGAGEMTMVYDVRDRLVFTQDARMKPDNQWVTTLYDPQNRPVISGITTWIGTTASLQLQVDQLTGVDAETSYQGMLVSRNPIPGTGSFTLLTKTGYDDYNNIPAASGLSGSIDNTYAGSPDINTAYTSFPYPDPVTQSRQTQGLPTWMQVKVLGTTSEYLYSVMLYDDKGRTIQVKSKNKTGGTDITTTQYTFTGQPLVQIQKQEKTGSSNPQTHVIVTKNTLNDLGQITSVSKKISSVINGVAVNKPETIIASNEYDALGNLLIKSIGQKKDVNNNYTGVPLQDLKYSYSIRNWVQGMNRDYLTIEGQTTDGVLFGYELGYDRTANKAGEAFAQGTFNGNITGMLWKSDGDDIRRKYDYTYDAADRLMRAEFKQQNTNDHLWNNSQVNYNVVMGDGTPDPTKAYDANGNILRMQQYGLKVTGPAQIDDLRYHYYKSELSNQLMTVSDGLGGGLGDFEDNNSTGNDYGYDANGNMVIDLNKQIKGVANPDQNMAATDGAITYNHLNLPAEIKIKDKNDLTKEKGTINYVYDALGAKLQKIVLEKSVTVTYNGQPYIGDVTTTTTYLGGAVYESKAYEKTELTSLGYTDKLQFISHEEGRTRFMPALNNKSAHYDHDYFIKDHLGNVRMVITDELQQDIYPAVTLEGSLGNPADAVYKEKEYYNIDINKIALRGDATGITDYINKNGGDLADDPPVNNNPNSNVTGLSQQLYKLKATAAGGETGLGITLKVMSGDRIDIFGKSYYFENNAGSDNYPIPVMDLLTGLLAAPTGATAGKAVTATSLNNIGDIHNKVSDFLTDPLRGNGTIPRAYINWVLLDENFKYLDGNFDRVRDANVVSDHQLMGIPVKRNGYLYVFVSNESPVEVFFDNLQVVHTKGPVLEETHYYPFGLTMAGISSKALNFGAPENKYRYNGIEQTTELDLDQYDAFYRNLDPQLGRWWQIDPKIERMEMWSPYVSNYDNPIRFNDPKGDCPACVFVLEELVETGVVIYRTYRTLETIEAVAGASAGSVLTPVEPVEMVITTDALGQTTTVKQKDYISFLVGREKIQGMLLAKKKSDEAEQATGGTYVLKDEDGKVQRSGRTKDLKRREKEHARAEETKDLEYEVDVRTNDYKVQRGREQQLHDKHKPALNKIKPIRDNHKSRDEYIQAAVDFIKNLQKGQKK
ncbi:MULTISPECIES: DUF6443 domain-containing protein [Niastella]|uniref:DUF6443 domain-containing protein n=1 Tax=Niastella soli TaxID=2821487 RepID=A0ABS3Z4K3_9BACT|nr:DUF6443 domain-containing protein [Niastella soli]MBO9204672.1 hypothetical protein [Niastella soli]